jgi:small subunit ribosomal protein S7
MARGKKKIKREIEPDPLYSNTMVAKFINYVMRRGKKSIARRIVYNTLEILKEKTKKDPVEVFEQAIKNAAPVLEVRPKRIGGATYQVPVEVRGNRRIALAMRWIIEAAKSRKGKPMHEKLAEEILEAANNTGAAIKKKENMHRMAEANKAFAHFA